MQQTSLCKSARPTIVLILGMHRSGTSLTAAVLNALGVILSDDLIPGRIENANGFFESQAIFRLHEELLNSMGSAWNGSTSIRPFPDKWWKSSAVLSYRQQIMNVIAQGVSSKKVWGFKDPRTARLLPLWNDAISEMDLEPRFVLVVRHPADVAMSLFVRDATDPALAEQLWLEHTADALLYTQERPLAVVDYDRWFTHPREQAKYVVDVLGLEPPSNAQIERAASLLICDRLRHHVSTPQKCVLPYSEPLYHALVARDLRYACAIAHEFHKCRKYTSTVIANERRRQTINAIVGGLRWLKDVFR